MNTTIRGTIDEHRTRCQPYLLRLRMVIAEAAQVPGRRAVAEVISATAIILAEAQAADQDARAASGSCREGTGAAALLQGRLSRLASAAAEAITAADRGDHAQMARHLHRFETLTAAIWTVQQAVFDPVPAEPLRRHPTGPIRRPGKELSPYRAPGVSAVLALRTQ